MQTGKYPLQELVFAIVANKTVGTPENSLSLRQITDEVNKHTPEPKHFRTIQHTARRLVECNWLTKVGPRYMVHPNQLNTVWLDRLHWLSFLEGPAKSACKDFISNEM